MATSGMPMPAWVARRCTVETSQASSAFAGWVMTRAPVERLAMNLDMASEISAPPKPRIAANTSRPPMSCPVLARYWSMPSRRIETDSTARTARLVARNRKIRFKFASPGDGLAHCMGAAGDRFKARTARMCHATA